MVGPYWNAEGKWKIRGMTAALIALTGLQIVIATSINRWVENIFDALENRDMDGFLLMIGAAIAIVAANIVVTIFHLAVKRWIMIDWRKWLTHRLLGEWMVSGRHYKVTQFGGEHSNPDGRIAEDIRLATNNAIDLAHSLLHAILIVVSFAAILWHLSGPSQVVFGELSFYLPGHMVWIAVLYATIGTVIALWLGLPLIKAQNLRQTTEADFRFGLAYARQHSLQVALLHGEENEDQSLRAIFRNAIRSWSLQTRALITLFYFTSTWWILSQVFPILVASPRYLVGAITLGVLMQTVQAFQQMVGAMSWPVDNVIAVADWRASAERVLGLHNSLAGVEEKKAADPTTNIRIEKGNDARIVFDGLSLIDPDGAPVMDSLSTEIVPRQRVLIAADSDVGFTLFKAIAGLWPWGSGRVVLPGGEDLFFASRRPYLPLRSLRATVSYPRPAREFSDAAMTDALGRVGLERLADALDRRAPWGEILSEDEQRRLTFARMLLFRPHWILLQGALDVLTPETRSAMLRLLEEEFSDAAVIVVSQTHDLDAFATRRIDLRGGIAVLAGAADRGSETKIPVSDGPFASARRE